MLRNSALEGEKRGQKKNAGWRRDVRARLNIFRSEDKRSSVVVGRGKMGNTLSINKSEGKRFWSFGF